MDTTSAPLTAASQPELLFQIAAVEALIEKFTGLKTDLRDIVGQQIAAAYEKDGTKCAVDVRIPGTKDKVGSVSTVLHAADVTAVRDTAAFTAWVTANHPTELEYADPFVKPAYVKQVLAEVEWLDDPEFVADPDDPDAEVPQVPMLVNKETGDLEIVPGLSYTAGGHYKNFAIGKRDNAKIMEYLGSINLAEVMGTSNAMIESGKTIAGEVGDDPNPVEPASEAVVAGEVVAREDDAA